MKIIGSNDRDALDGTDFVDQILGLRGNDTIKGFGGDDWLAGSAASDQLYGGSGNDHIWGGVGNDAPFRYTDFTVGLTIEHAGGIFGNAGDDVIFGGGGVDLVRGGDRNDVIHGGRGDDAHVEYFIDVIQLEVNGGLNGGAGDDVIYGDSGADALNGEDGSDTLSGGTGNDTLTGGAGADDINGGDGADRIVYSSVGDSGDFISGFVSGADKIDLFLIDANAATPANDTFAFQTAQNQNVLANTVTWYQDTGAAHTIIQADVTGDAVADFVLTLDGLITLAPGDFIL